MALIVTLPVPDELLQVPPLTGLVAVAVPATQTESVPSIAAGVGLTVTVAVLLQPLGKE